ncbi:hypothetical protein CDAR_189711 [Caerostris darwini]|uniref:Uncharacterized protein n=1 Tax=Caerostris darwini TaxID=1538125 RepID=A0AAV4VE59_9ARAC|nr:hypothetical protein CDAR_189711 [Caerostris darwini]
MKSRPDITLNLSSTVTRCCYGNAATIVSTNTTPPRTLTHLNIRIRFHLYPDGILIVSGHGPLSGPPPTTLRRCSGNRGAHLFPTSLDRRFSTNCVTGKNCDASTETADRVTLGPSPVGSFFHVRQCSDILG